MKAFIVTVMEQPDSVKYAQECAQSCFSFGVQAELYAAFFLDAGIDFINSRGISIRKNLIPRLKIKMSGKGVIGCFASHYSLWERCATQDEMFLILEEDALMVRSMPRVPVRGVLNLDPLPADRPDYLQRFKLLQNSDEDGVTSSIGLMFFDMTTDGEAFHYMYGTYAYLITPLAAQALVKATQNRGYLAADVMINDATVAIDCVTKSVFLHRSRPYSLSRIQ